MTLARTRPALTVLGALLALTLVACGGSSGSSGADDAAAPGGAGTTAPADTSGGSDSDSSDEAPDPCSLLTAADLGTAYGLEFADGAAKDSDVANQNAGLRGCEYTTEGGSFLLQTTSGGALGSDIGDFFDQSKMLYPDATDGGVGDQSILLPQDAGFLALQGDVFVQGNLVAFGVDAKDGGTPAVLETVVGNLP